MAKNGQSGEQAKRYYIVVCSARAALILMKNTLHTPTAHRIAPFVHTRMPVWKKMW